VLLFSSEDDPEFFEFVLDPDPASPELLPAPWFVVPAPLADGAAPCPVAPAGAPCVLSLPFFLIEESPVVFSVFMLEVSG
jgi:hypothetical protein